MSETAIFVAGLPPAEAELEAPAEAAAELAALGEAPVPEQAAMSTPAPSNAMNRRIPDPWICPPVRSYVPRSTSSRWLPLLKGAHRHVGRRAAL